MKKLIKWIKSLFISKPSKNAKLGWKRDLPDPRDFKFKITSPLLMQELPLVVDLRDKCPPVYDQGDLGSCGANAMGATFQFEQKKRGFPDFMPSRLYIYYNTRVLEGTVNSDSGVTLRNSMKAMVNDGVCPETMWKYQTCKFKRKPPQECYVEGRKNQVLEYLRVTHTLNEIKGCLAEGYPITFGMMLYESFMSDEVARSGKVPMPNFNSESSLGGHAVVAVGYDEHKKHFIVRNSWGRGWGDRGYFYLPYQYVTMPNLTADYWIIKLVEDPENQVNVVFQNSDKKKRRRKPKKNQ